MEKIKLTTINGYCWVEPQDIVAFQIEDKQTFVHLTTGLKMPLNMSLVDCFAKVKEEAYFFQLSRSALINVQHAFRYLNGDVKILQMCNNMKIAVPASRKAALFEQLKNMAKK